MSITATSTTFNPLSSLYTFSRTPTNFPHCSVFTSPLRYNGARLLGFVPRAVSSQEHGVFDSELHSVLQLATGSELYEVERILFGTSYFSPLLKSIAKPSDIDYVMIEEDPEEREEFISILEARFFFLAADARSSLRGWRPTYRNVLLGVRKELKIPCSTKLSTEDLEIEIFLHLLQEYSSEGFGSLKRGSDSLEVGLSPWKVQAFAALGRGTEEFITMILKGGGMFTLGRLYNLISSKLSGKVFLEAANYQIKKEVLKEGGRLAAINLESRAAVLAAKQGLAGAASRYLGVRSIMVLLGPMLWGTFLADLVIQMLGTDYARILRAIYAFAQILGCYSVTKTIDGLFLTQGAYAANILSQANMQHCKPCSTLVDTDCKLSVTAGAPLSDVTLYRSLAGAIQYLTFTTLDISYVVQQVCLFMHALREPHF